MEMFYIFEKLKVCLRRERETFNTFSTYKIWENQKFNRKTKVIPLVRKDSFNIVVSTLVQHPFNQCILLLLVQLKRKRITKELIVLQGGEGAERMKTCNIQIYRKLSFICSATHKIIFVCNMLGLLFAQIGLMIPF